MFVGSLSFAGLTLEVTSPSHRVGESLIGRYPRIVAAPAAPASEGGIRARLEFLPDPSIVPSDPRTVFTYTVRSGDGAIRISSSALAVAFDLARMVGTARVREAFSWCDLENAMRVLSSRLLPLRGLVLLHAAAVARDGRAWLFPGTSGTGKSTISTLSAEAGLRVLSDDLVAVGMVNGLPEVHATPFWGDAKVVERSLGAVALAGICHPVKAAIDEVIPMGTVDSLARTLISLPFLEGASRAEVERPLELLEPVVAAVPSYELRFRKSAEFWKLLP